MLAPSLLLYFSISFNNSSTGVNQNIVATSSSRLILRIPPPTLVSEKNRWLRRHDRQKPTKKHWNLRQVSLDKEMLECLSLSLSKIRRCLRGASFHAVTRCRWYNGTDITSLRQYWKNFEINKQISGISDYIFLTNCFCVDRQMQKLIMWSSSVSILFFFAAKG